MFFRKTEKNKKEFEKIYGLYVDQIFRFAYLKVSSKDEAEDITSQTFLRFWKHFSKEKKRPQNPKAFIYKTATNLIIDYYRKTKTKKGKDGSSAKKEVSVEDIVIEDREMRADQKLVIKAEIEDVRKALSKINEDYQNAIIWYYLDELTIPEIADLLEKSETSVRVLIHRALNSLKEEIIRLEKSSFETK